MPPWTNSLSAVRELHLDAPSSMTSSGQRPRLERAPGPLWPRSRTCRCAVLTDSISLYRALPHFDAKRHGIIRMAKLNLSQALSRAISAYNAGKLVEVEQLCQQIINTNSAPFEAL